MQLRWDERVPQRRRLRFPLVVGRLVLFRRGFLVGRLGVFRGSPFVFG
jgi:hypothetical protein